MKKYGILLIFLLLSCTADKGNFAFYLSPINKYQNKIVKNGAIVLVPGGGCTGCITGMETFIDTNYLLYPNVVYVFTNIQSIKLLKLKLSSVMFESSDNIIVDLNNDFFNMADKNKIYPSVLHLKNMHVQKIDYISPESKFSIEQILSQYK